MRVDDEAAIRRLSCRYAKAFDDNDGDLLAALFVPEGRLEAPNGSFVGTAALRAAPAVVAARYVRTFHAVLNQTIEMTGDGASGTTYGIARHLLEDDSGGYFCREMTLRYADRYARHGGEWCFAHRRLLLDWIHEYPVKPG